MSFYEDHRVFIVVGKHGQIALAGEIFTHKNIPFCRSFCPYGVQRRRTRQWCLYCIIPPPGRFCLLIKTESLPLHGTAPQMENSTLGGTANGKRPKQSTAFSLFTNLLQIRVDRIN